MATLQSYALTTVADVKESLGIASSVTTSDNLIIRKINQATAVLENYCGRRFKATSYTDELYNGSQIDQLVLKQRPLIIDDSNPLTIKVRNTALNLSDYETVEADLIFADAPSGVVDLMFRARGRWGRYAVSYRAGYDTIPDDLAEAAATLAAYFVTNANGEVNVRRKQEGSRTIDYYEKNKNLYGLLQQLGIDSVIDSYANMPVFADK